MTFPEFVLLVQNMRRAQSAYFKTRTTSALQEAKALEQKVDDAVTEFFADFYTNVQEEQAQLPMDFPPKTHRPGQGKYDT